VTNLFSSAIFVGWGSVLLGVIVERMFKNGWGSLGSASVGFLTQIIALHLAAQGDTMEMMRAVLDSNFWLATHVVTVTAGYSATFLAGILGVVYILRGVFSKNMGEDTAQNLTRMVYGIVCFSAFFSFIGTVLGGIWADQSWGRFWGWDPKENGALMIVLWNALILHMWWDKQVGRRGLMNLAVFGNIITALSWFGVNMLGIGLHSYGFMDKASLWLIVFSLSQMAVIGLGALPARFWGSPGTVS
jgi:ABC-type transport system involved in cytochrome c biogenesis permease subunit